MRVPFSDFSSSFLSLLSVSFCSATLLQIQSGIHRLLFPFALLLSFRFNQVFIVSLPLFSDFNFCVHTFLIIGFYRKSYEIPFVSYSNQMRSSSFLSKLFKIFKISKFLSKTTAYNYFDCVI